MTEAALHHDLGTQQHLTARTSSEWRRGGKVVLAAALGVGLMSAPAYSIGVFLPALEAEFGWTRAAISSATMFHAVTSVLLGAFFGMAIDRFGPRRIAIAGVILVCAGFAMLAATTSDIWSWWGIWAFIALAAMLIMPSVWTAAVSSLFTQARGMALAVTLCGTSLASVALPLFATWLIGAFGWRIAYLVLGASLLLIVLPPIVLFFYSAVDSRRVQRGNAADVPLAGLGIREGLTSSRFIRLAIATVALVMVGSTLTVNMVPILLSFGHSREAAAGVASLTGMCAIAGRLLGGFLLDRINGNVVAGASISIVVIAISLLLAFPQSLGAVAAAGLVVGLVMGAEFDAVAYLTSRHFGMRSFGALYGVIGGMISLASAIGGVALNYTYDLSGSYVLSLWCLFPLCLTGSVLFFTLGRYPDFPEPADIP